jgi:hypothetical protein
MEEFEKRNGYLLGRLEKMYQQVDAIERLRGGVSVYAAHAQDFQADRARFLPS